MSREEKLQMTIVERVLWLIFVSTLILFAIGPFLPRLLPFHWDYYCGPYDTLFAALAVLFVYALIKKAIARWSSLNSAIALIKPVIGLLVAVPIAGFLQRFLLLKQISDYHAYVKLGTYLAKHGISGLMTLDAWRPPGMAFALALPLRFGLSANGAVLFVNTLSLVIFVTALATICNGITISRIVGVATILCLVPLIAMFMMVGLSELPACALQLVALALLLSDTKASGRLGLWKWFAAGCCTALAALFRPVLVIQLLGFFSAAVLNVGLDLTFARRVKAASVVVVVLSLGFTIVVLPWTIRNYIVLGELLPISYNGGEVFYSANSSSAFEQQGSYTVSHYSQLRKDVADPLVRNKIGFRRGLSAIFRHPWVFVESFPYRTGKMLGGLLVWPVKYLSIPGAAKLSYPQIRMSISVINLFGGWMLLLLIKPRLDVLRHVFVGRRSIHWLYWCLALVLFASLLFECAQRYAITLIPYIVAIVCISLRKQPQSILTEETSQ
ncbi:MAG: hypothetical protein ACOX3G_10810 [Armatimonadota bacterium]